MNEDISEQAIGRVLRASTSGFVIGSRVNQLSRPAFGGLVKAQPVDDREIIYGLIVDMHIDDDPLVRRLVMTQDPEPQVIDDQRSNRLLPVEMSVLTVGYRRDSVIRHSLPPRPPLNLDPAYMCADSQEVKEFSDRLGYLRLILRAADGKIAVEQLLMAHFLNMYELRGNDAEWVLAAVTELIELLRGDYALLVPTLEALSASLPELETIQQADLDL